MEKPLTVGELRKALEGVPDNLEVQLSIDTGVGQGEGQVAIEETYRVQYSVTDYFTIYANDTGGEDDSDDCIPEDLLESEWIKKLSNEERDENGRPVGCNMRDDYPQCYCMDILAGDEEGEDDE